MLKRIFYSVLCLSVLSASIFVSKVKAQDGVYDEGVWYAPTVEEFNAKVNEAEENEIFGERYTQAQVYWIFHSLAGVLMGQGLGECAADNQDDLVGFLGCAVDILFNPESSGDAGAIVPLARMGDALMVTRPASGVEYIASNLRDLNLVPETFAQGYGYQTLQPIQGLWRAARDAAFALITLAVVIVAFMIMFRVKISPHAVVSVQSSIPRIALAIVLIAFSYAIAGLIIDLSAVLLGIVMLLINGSGLVDITGVEGGVTAYYAILNNVLTGMTSFSLMVVGYTVVLGGFVAESGAGGFLLAGAGGALGIIIAIVIFVTMIIAMIRVIWTLLRSFLVVMLLTISGPFFFLIGAVSPRGEIITGWLKAMVANMSAFVIIPLTILMAHVVLWSTIPGLGEAAGIAQGVIDGLHDTLGIDLGGVVGEHVNPYQLVLSVPGTEFGTVSFPALTGIPMDILGMLMGIVILLAAPGIAGFVRDSISKPSRYDLGIGQALVPGAFAGSMAAGYYANKVGVPTSAINTVAGIPYVGRPAAGLLRKTTGALKTPFRQVERGLGKASGRRTPHETTG